MSSRSNRWHLYRPHRAGRRSRRTYPYSDAYRDNSLVEEEEPPAVSQRELFSGHDPYQFSFSGLGKLNPFGWLAPSSPRRRGALKEDTRPEVPAADPTFIVPQPGPVITSPNYDSEERVFATRVSRRHSRSSSVSSRSRSRVE